MRVSAAPFDQLGQPGHGPPAGSARAQSARPGQVQRMLEARVPIWAVGLIVAAGAAFTVAFGAILIAPGQRGPIGRAAESLASVPATLQKLWKALPPYRPGIAGDYARLPGGLTRNPAFTDPGYLLLSDFDTARSRRVVKLIRLSDGKLLRDYAPDVGQVHAGSTFRSELIDLKRDKGNRLYFPMHPALMPDGGLLLHDTSPLVRVDACGRREWMVDGIFHHAVEPAGDGSWWAGYREPRSAIPGVGPKFAEEGITHVSADGKILHRESMAAILDRNGLSNWWRGRPYSDDPFHLNDIQPVRASGRYWQQGDLLLSLRNTSAILLYRPSTGKVIWHKEGPWRFQHDVNILDDHRISVFDNHWRFAWDQREQAQVDGTNHMLVYDLASGAVSDPMATAFAAQNIRTVAQGRATPLSNGDVMVEESEQGRLLRLAPDGTVRWRYIAADADKRRYELRWSRYLDPNADAVGIQAAVNAKCT
jgi:hypothetical protein